MAGNVIQDKNYYPAIVISTGGSMTDDSAIKNRYSCDESRNLSRVWEYSRIEVTHEYLKCQCEIIPPMQLLTRSTSFFIRRRRRRSLLHMPLPWGIIKKRTIFSEA